MRILIIEDNAEIRDLLRIGLEAEMFLVDEASDGEQGSYMARTNEYDMVLLDNVLPKRHGSDVCKDIRRAGKSMPIILISMKTDPSEKAKLLTLGADDYLAKPFSFTELLARMRAVLRRPSTLISETIVAGSLSLNSRTHQVTVGKSSIYLTKKEFSILELLVRRSGEVVSRGTIMEHVWDMDGNPFSNTIETHVFNIRRKIENGRKRIIWNVPGRGYKLTPALAS